MVATTHRRRRNNQTGVAGCSRLVRSSGVQVHRAKVSQSLRLSCVVESPYLPLWVTKRREGEGLANLDLFGAEVCSAAPLDAPLDEAERLLQALADYIYGHTSLKPMSKTLFVVSRCLLAAVDRCGDTVDEVVRSYRRSVKKLGSAAPTDDFDFASTLQECESHLGRILFTVDRVKALSAGSDSLGLTFNALLRGKWESGEGLGTHLTPEEVVAPMVTMVLHSIHRPLLDQAKSEDHPLLFGDPCGGTGRFVYRLARELREVGFDQVQISAVTRLYDQSSLSVDFARLNFAFDGLVPAFSRVDDSLTAPEVSGERGRYLAIATNPPFGSGKYSWSRALEQALGPEILKSIGIGRLGDACDPAELFVFRCLDLLTDGGVLAIVLPDGVVHARRFKQALERYERIKSQCALHVLAIVSLPPVTFSLGGTVAKTSFLLIRKDRRNRDIPLYVARANYIGFKKRGNRRVTDSNGNDLTAVTSDYLCRSNKQGDWVTQWRQVNRLMPSMLLGKKNRKQVGTPLSKMVDIAQERGRHVECGDRHWYHISVLDIDDTGLIDVASASGNRPSTPPLACRSGDVLVSCINPRIWRVTVVPEFDGDWTCSSEFAVLRPRGGVDAWELALCLHHRDVMDTVTALAGGTSSSRQRVNRKALVEDVVVPKVDVDPKILARHRKDREAFYRVRMSEYRALARLHEGERCFLPDHLSTLTHLPLASTASSKETTL